MPRICQILAGVHCKQVIMMLLMYTGIWQCAHHPRMWPSMFRHLVMQCSSHS